MQGLTLNVVEQNRTSPVQLLLDAGDFQIGVDLLVGDYDVTLFFHPFDCAPQISNFIRRGAISLSSLLEVDVRDLRVNIRRRLAQEEP